MEREKLWYLKNFNVFKGVPESEIQKLAPLVKDDEYKRGKPIYLQGEPNGWIYFLKEGLVKLSMNSTNGKTVTVALLKPGEVFGDLTFTDEPTVSTEAVALRDSLLCRVPRAQFLSMARANIQMVFVVNKILGLRLRRVEAAIQDLLFLDVPARLAKLLTDIAASDGEDVPEGRRITLRLTHQELANLVGATRVMVTMVLGKLENEGFIRQKMRRIIITNPQGLQKLFRPH